MADMWKCLNCGAMISMGGECCGFSMKLDNPVPPAEASVEPEAKGAWELLREMKGMVATLAEGEPVAIYQWREPAESSGWLDSSANDPRGHLERLSKLTGVETRIVYTHPSEPDGARAQEAQKDFVPRSVRDAYNHINDALSWLDQNEDSARAILHESVRCTSTHEFRTVDEEDLILRCSEAVNHGEHRNSGIRWTEPEGARETIAVMIFNQFGAHGKTWDRMGHKRNVYLSVADDILVALASQPAATEGESDE